MKILIAAAGKTGTAMTCAERLAVLLEGAQVADLTLSWPDPEEYDAVIVGGSIRMGQLHRKARSYLVQHRDALLARPLGCFICCALTEEAEGYLKKNIPAPLLEHAAAAVCLGGRLAPRARSGMDKFLAASFARSLEKGGRPAPTIDDEAIRQLARQMRLAADRG